MFFVIVLSCHLIGQAFVIIECSSHFQAISITSFFSAVNRAVLIADSLSGITQKSSHNFLFIQGITSLIISLVFSV